MFEPIDLVPAAPVIPNMRGFTKYFQIVPVEGTTIWVSRSQARIDHRYHDQM